VKWARIFFKFIGKPKFADCTGTYSVVYNIRKQLQKVKQPGKAGEPEKGGINLL